MNAPQASTVTVHTLPSQLAAVWPELAQRSQSQLCVAVHAAPSLGGSAGQPAGAMAQPEPLASHPKTAGQQRTPQTVVSVGQELSQTLATHVESPQARPHEPQFAESFVRSTQLPAQSVSPVVQPPPSAPASTLESPPASTFTAESVPASVGVLSSPHPRATRVRERASILYVIVASFRSVLGEPISKKGANEDPWFRSRMWGSTVPNAVPGWRDAIRDAGPTQAMPGDAPNVRRRRDQGLGDSQCERVRPS